MWVQNYILFSFRPKYCATFFALDLTPPHLTKQRRASLVTAPGVLGLTDSDGHVSLEQKTTWRKETTETLGIILISKTNVKKIFSA